MEKLSILGTFARVALLLCSSYFVALSRQRMSCVCLLTLPWKLE